MSVYKGIKKEYIKLLVKHGARPDIKDNDGCSPLLMAKFFPDVLQLLKQGDKKEIKKQRKVATETEDFRKCALCKKSGSKRCTGCYFVMYCGAECQRNDWEAHKESCKARRAEFVPMTLATQDFNSTFFSFNYSSGESYLSPTDGWKKESSDYFKVKVQRRLNENISYDKKKKTVSCTIPADPLLVYNKERTVMGKLVVDTPIAQTLLDVILTKGFHKVKGYFHVIKKKDQLLINPEILPPETW